MRSEITITPEQYHASLDFLWGALSQVGNTKSGNVFELCHHEMINQKNRIKNLESALIEYDKAMGKINEHAETCSIFIWDDKDCTCYYPKVQETRKEFKELIEGIKND